jgi:hypothetical protein
MDDRNPPEAFTDVNEAVGEEWAAETTPYERVRAVVAQTYSPVSADAVADEARIDVRRTTRDDYAFHYMDSTEVDLRWGRHPHGGDYVRVTDTEHYHPPPDARSDPNTVDDSCVAVSPAVLVTRAVLKLWRVAYHHGSLAALNAGENPP